MPFPFPSGWRMDNLLAQQTVPSPPELRSGVSEKQCGLVLEVVSFMVRSWGFLFWMACWLEEWSLGRVEPLKVMGFFRHGGHETRTKETFLSKTMPGGLGARNDGDERGSRRDSMVLLINWSFVHLGLPFFCRTFDCKSTSPKEEANICGGCRSSQVLQLRPEE